MHLKFIMLQLAIGALTAMYPRLSDANDTEVTLAAGGLIPIRSTQIEMVSENLDISAHSVNVRYMFLNTTDHDIDAEVLILRRNTKAAPAGVASQ